MAKARQIVKRRKAVSNIKKITRTMQLIATAKYQKCLQRAMGTKPYTQRITQLVTELAGQVTDINHPLLQTNSGSGRVAVLVITSNRGLCGGYNAQILRTALERFRQVEASQRQIQLQAAGKKAIAYFRFLGRALHKSYSHFDDRVRFEQVQGLADEFMAAYERQEVDAVYVVYMRYISTARQRPEIIQLLPMSAPQSEQKTTEAATPVQYEFSPSPGELLAELLPESVRVRLFQCFTDAAVSEQVARMVAMKAATDAAGDMIKYLTRTYNRARQTQITMELLDIVGGANAISAS
ncbi:MAG: ATP synthase gamma chain [Phycisphaerae bacterium]|nr:ATP synthase gamma chain [Phycisphaerae bacterium]